MKVMTRLRQLIGSCFIKAVQQYGPRTVDVLGSSYAISKDVFNPRAFCTSKLMARHMNVGADDDVLDVGTGSGILAITAGRVARRVVATDINPEAVRCARENVKRNGLEDVVLVLQGDLFSALDRGDRFDVILFSPPYMEGRLRTAIDHAIYDPEKALAKRFLRDAKDYLKPMGYVQMYYSSVAGLDRFLEMASRAGWICTPIAKHKGFLETFVVYRMTVEQ